MGKKKFYAVRYADNTGLIFNNYDDYQNGIKGFSNSSSKGFNRVIKSVPISLQREIVELIKDNELDIHFLNVKSHTGIVGNSVADRIAKDISNHLNKLDLLRDLSFLN